MGLSSGPRLWDASTCLPASIAGGNGLVGPRCAVLSCRPMQAAEHRGRTVGAIAVTDQLAYALITPYSLFKSRTGGIIGRLLAHARLEFVGARMYVFSDAFVDAYKKVICPAGYRPGR